MDDVFGGDYGKAVEAHKNIQGLQTQTAQASAAKDTTIADLQAQIAKLSSPTPTPAPTPNASGSGGGSLYDWHNGSMVDAAGQVDAGLMAAMAEAKAPPEVVQAMVSTIEQAKNIIKSNAQQTIITEMGSQESYTAMTQWLSTTKSPAEQAAINTMLDNPDTLNYALQGLKAEYVAAGNSIETQTDTPDVGVNEPSALPNTTGGGYTGVTPLTRGSPELYESLQAAIDDPSKMPDHERRVALGIKQ